MKTIKYKTLNGLLNQTRQMTVEQFLNKRFHHNTKGWINFELEGYCYEIVLERFSKYCFSSKKAQNKLFLILSIITVILLCFNVFILIKGALAVVYPVKLLITV